jgi:hypothetical protein
MRPLAFALLFFTSFALAQNNPAATTDNSKPDKGSVTVQGCVTRSNGDYTLIKQDPGVSYELQSTGKIKLKNYLGQRVEVTGDQSPSMSTSSDAMNRMGSASPVTITVRSIKTVDKECPLR